MYNRKVPRQKFKRRKEKEQKKKMRVAPLILNDGGGILFTGAVRSWGREKRKKKRGGQRSQREEGSLGFLETRGGGKPRTGLLEPGTKVEGLCAGGGRGQGEKISRKKITTGQEKK